MITLLNWVDTYVWVLYLAMLVFCVWVLIGEED